MKTAIALLICFLSFSMAYAQELECAGNTPCLAVPWRMPVLPNLSSPTPMPTLNITQAVNNSNPVATATPAAYSTLTGVDTGSLGSHVATLNAIMQSTPIALNDFSGSFAEATEAIDYGGQAATMFSYIKGLSQVNIGATMTPLLWWAIAAFMLTITLSLGGFVAPIVAVLFGAIRRIVSTVLDFLPL